jgi:hypothetical protein
MKFQTTLLVAMFASCIVNPANAIAADADLAKAPYFAFGGVGFAGTTSEGDVAYKKMLACDDAEERLVKIFESGSNPAKAYALHGLHSLKSKRYPEFKKRFLKKAPSVKRMSGCLMGKDSAAQIIAYIEKAPK